MKILITIFLLWLLYKLVFNFIIPVYQSTKHVRQQMGDIQARMRQQYQQQQQAQQAQQTSQQQQQRASQQQPADKGDYIDFEELK
jgi:Sec-independent protein translocase protein TatA